MVIKLTPTITVPLSAVTTHALLAQDLLTINVYHARATPFLTAVSAHVFLASIWTTAETVYLVVITAQPVLILADTVHHVNQVPISLEISVSATVATNLTLTEIVLPSAAIQIALPAQAHHRINVLVVRAMLSSMVDNVNVPADML